MRKKKDIELANGDIIIPGEIVRYVSHNGGWYIGTLVKQVGKRLVIDPGYTYDRKKRRNIWVAISDVQKLPMQTLQGAQ